MTNGMKKNRSLFVYLFVLFFFSVNLAAQDVVLKTKELAVSIDEKGYYSAIHVGRADILKSKNTYPLVSVLSKGKLITPKSMKTKGDLLELKMEDGGSVALKYMQSDISLKLEVASISSQYEVLLYGPVMTKLNDVVGDIIGVVQGEGVAFGVQALNIKTCAGLPADFVEVIAGKFPYTGMPADLSVESTPYYDLAATDTGDGSVLQFSVRRRDKLEFREVMRVKNSMVLPVEGEDALIEGSSIALFGCKAADALEYLGKIEQEHGLPHAMVEGEWSKTARASMKSYLISNFGAKDMDFILEKTKKAGLDYLYHSGPFENWGEFRWEKALAEDGSDVAMKRLVDKAKSQGVTIGVHTLSNFITTNDPYVTPIPSKHLLKQGILKLTGDIDAAQTEISIEKSGLFEVPLTLNALQIEDELISFGKVEEEGEYMILKDCKRGAFDTKASKHPKNKELYKLWDYPYKTLFPDLELQDKMADRITQIINEVGIGQISFDGLEGCKYTGHDTYATARFVSRTYDKWNHSLINDASRLNHYMWHIYTRMNWGEPWGEEMRQGQIENRIKNQEYYKRNLFPRMLGWFLIRLQERKFECSTLEDLEWALAKSAGFDAGYALVINVNTLKKHGQIDYMLETVKNWDELRLADVFTDKQKAELKKTETEWKLEKIDDKNFNLFPVDISKRYTCDLSELQPGQPGGADWSLDTQHGGSYALRIRIQGEGVIQNPSFTTPKGVIKFIGEVEAGQYLLYDFNQKATITDKNFNYIRDIEAQGSAEVEQGVSAIAFACDFDSSDSPEVEVRFITRGKPEVVSKK